jgi:microcystin-dependent protein
MDNYLGQIELFPYTFAPMGWVLCNGAIINIMQNTALYSLIGIQFGGDGRTTFGLPNMTNMSPTPGMEYYIAVTGIYPNRD